jgi:hypothetical protein
MAARGPIPTEAVELFNMALALFYAWMMDELRERHIEPSIVQKYSIGTVCDLVQVFDDPMPTDAHELLISLAGAHAVPAPTDGSYVSGARCLRALSDRYLELLERTRFAAAVGLDNRC